MNHVVLLSLVTAVLFCNSVLAQSPRLQLFEYFDNTSIPAFVGADDDSVFNALLAANAGKITCIKYHVDWGSETGTDPMNLHNTAQVADRVAYYRVFADPVAYQQGSTYWEFPADITQEDIDSLDSATAPFTIAVSHYLNTAQDTIFTRTVIKKTGVTTGTLAAHVVVIEKEIHFATAPGVSGVTDFVHVMKRMLPSAQGTTLSAMNVGDSVVLNLSWALANVYDASQLAVVSFVQNKDTSSREIYQAGFSAVATLPTAISPVKNVDASDIFPNPFEHQINLRINNDSQSEITIYNSASAQVFHQQFTRFVAIDTKSLPPGIYLYEVKNDGIIVKSGKIMKE